jgi:hypothetical protein
MRKSDDLHHRNAKLLKERQDAIDDVAMLGDEIDRITEKLRKESHYIPEADEGLGYMVDYADALGEWRCVVQEEILAASSDRPLKVRGPLVDPLTRAKFRLIAECADMDLEVWAHVARIRQQLKGTPIGNVIASYVRRERKRYKRAA